MIQTSHRASTRVLTSGFGPQLSNGLLCLRASAVTSTAPVRSFSLAAANKVTDYESSTRPAKRRFSFTPSNSKEFFPEPNSVHIRETKPAWPHPIYTESQMIHVIIAHREAKNWPDYIALGMVRFLRWGLDFATGYKHDEAVAKGVKAAKDGQQTFAMDERKYMIRNVFLESVAGVPGMVGGMLRHLASLRKMKRDNGWIETLLEESYNERMHLLTFLKMYEPGWFMRTMVLLTQGVFFNGFFIAYLMSPRICHRFVGYLEEEAVITYTRQIEDLENGKLPKWENLQAPDIAVKYWNMPPGNQKMRDLLMYIRADESKHREVNHTLGNLAQEDDPNPYASEYKDGTVPHPTKDISHQRPTGWERRDVV